MKYKVYAEFKEVYFIEVEADSETDALNKAEEIVTANWTRDDDASTGLEVTDVERL